MAKSIAFQSLNRSFFNEIAIDNTDTRVSVVNCLLLFCFVLFSFSQSDALIQSIINWALISFFLYSFFVASPMWFQIAYYFSVLFCVRFHIGFQINWDNVIFLLQFNWPFNVTNQKISILIFTILEPFFLTLPYFLFSF